MIHVYVFHYINTDVRFYVTQIGRCTFVVFCIYFIQSGSLRGLAVACWTTDHYHPCSNIGVGISEGCFVITLGGRSAHLAYPVHKGGRKTSINHHFIQSVSEKLNKTWLLHIKSWIIKTSLSSNHGYFLKIILSCLYLW